MRSPSVASAGVVGDESADDSLINRSMHAGERIISASEMHLDQVKAICSPSTRQAIELCKDKAAMRRALQPLYPDYTFNVNLDSDLSD